MPRKAPINRTQRALQRVASSDGSSRRVLYTTHPGPQTDFMLTPAEEVLYGGAKGGGKSHALRAFGVNYCMTYPGATVVLFRESFPQLEETHLLRIQQEIPPSVATYATAKHDLIFPNGSIFMFRYCEKDEDARRHDTAEFDVILFDELTAFSQFAYTYLISRCRSTKKWWPGPRIRSGATPLGSGHAWVQDRWRIETDDPIPPFQIWRTPISEGGMTRQFIPASVTDNVTLMEGDPTYVTRLRTLPYEEYQAAMGNWSVFTGQFFQRWRPDIHVIAAFDIPPDWERFLCVDYGFGAPYACLWFARPPGSDLAFVYREHYGRAFIQAIRSGRR
mgnify:FL=1